MQEGHLFDDEDPKERGQGCDSLCADDKRLKFKWKWCQFKNGEPCQVSYAEAEDGWSLQAVFWHTCYEACIDRLGNYVGRYNVDQDESTLERPALLTRIDAQLKAEELFEGIGKNIVRQCESR